jgi:hypothetical protein
VSDDECGRMDATGIVPLMSRSGHRLITLETE